MSFSQKDLTKFSYPAYKYAKRNTAHLDILGVDKTEDKEIKMVAPALLAKLPYEVFELLPNKPDIKQIIECLESYDREDQTLGSLVSSTSSLWF